jgi:hypothetical protein
MEDIERVAQVVPEARLIYVVRDTIARMQSMYMHQVSAGRERRRSEVALLDDRYLGPSLCGLQLAAYLDHFDRSQVLVIASEVLRDKPREALTAVFDHLAVDPAAVDLDKRHQDHRWTSRSRACTISSGYRDARSSSIRDGDPINAPG